MKFIWLNQNKTINTIKKTRFTCLYRRHFLAILWSRYQICVSIFCRLDFLLIYQHTKQKKWKRPNVEFEKKKNIYRTNERKFLVIFVCNLNYKYTVFGPTHFTASIFNRCDSFFFFLRYFYVCFNGVNSVEIWTIYRHTLFEVVDVVSLDARIHLTSLPNAFFYRRHCVAPTSNQ